MAGERFRKAAGVSFMNSGFSSLSALVASALVALPSFRPRSRGGRQRSYGKPRKAVQRNRHCGIFTFASAAFLLAALPFPAPAQDAPAQSAPVQSAPAQASAAQATPADARAVKIVALGDSLTAGFGLPADAAFPARLAAALKARGDSVAIVNAGVSGDTSAGGLERLDWAVPQDADAVIVELGANDMLRGIDPKITRRNIDAIVGKLRGRGQQVLVAGMMAAPNLGRDYGEAYNRIFAEIAKAHDALYYPFFLNGIVGDARLNQKDGLHPTAEGVDVIVKNILPAVEELIAKVRAKARS